MRCFELMPCQGILRHRLSGQTIRWISSCWNDDVAAWCNHTDKLINHHGKVLREMQAAGGELTLFVSACGHPVLRFESRFLNLLAEFDISLEGTHEGA